MEGGWIKLHRSMLEWEWWGDDRMVKMFLYLLLSCNTEPGKFRGVDILPGEVIIGRKMLAERLHMDERAVRATLDKLVSTGEIARWTNNHFTKITVKNWQKYQFANQLSNQQPTDSQPVVQPNDAVLPSKPEASDQKSANHLSNQTPTNCPTTCHKQEVRIIKENPLTGVKEKIPTPPQGFHFPHSVDEVLELAKQPWCGMKCSREQADAYFTDRVSKNWIPYGQHQQISSTVQLCADLKKWLLRDQNNENERKQQNANNRNNFSGKYDPADDGSNV